MLYIPVSTPHLSFVIVKMRSEIVNHNSFNFSVHKFDKDKLYDNHLKNKDEVYDMIMRSVKMITNFARTG